MLAEILPDRVFADLFSQLSDEQLKCKAGCVVFTVMDYDYLSSNDFAGEAYIALGSIFGISKKQTPGKSALTPMILTLMHWKGQKESSKS